MTNSLTSNEREERLLQQLVETPAGERIRMKCGAADLRSVITDLLSLLDSKPETGVTVSVLTGYEVGRKDGEDDMRTACVERVKARLAVLEKQTSESGGLSRACCEGRDSAIRDILKDLQSLTLDQVQEKQ